MCKERIWNQGKAVYEDRTNDVDCAKSGFGIKAKLSQKGWRRNNDCAKSGFGIKAKPTNQLLPVRINCAKSGFGIKAKP